MRGATDRGLALRSRRIRSVCTDREDLSHKREGSERGKCRQRSPRRSSVNGWYGQGDIIQERELSEGGY